MKTKSANANSGPHDFPRRNGSGLERCPGYGRERNLSSRTHTHTHYLSLFLVFVHPFAFSVYLSKREGKRGGEFNYRVKRSER